MDHADMNIAMVCDAHCDVSIFAGHGLLANTLARLRKGREMADPYQSWNALRVTACS